LNQGHIYALSNKKRKSHKDWKILE